MNTKHTNVQVVGSRGPLPPAKPTNNKWKLFGTLERLADQIVEDFDGLRDLYMDLSRREPGAEPPDARVAEVSEQSKQKIERCEALIAELDDDALYDDDEEQGRYLKKPLLAERLALMLAAVSRGAPKTGSDGFAKLLLEHVNDKQPSFLVLESACRRIETGEDWSQSIKEVLTMIDEQEAVWEHRRWAIRHIETEAAEVRTLIAKVQKACIGEQAEAAFAEARDNARRTSNFLNRATKDVIDKQKAAAEAHAQAVEAMRVWTINKQEHDHALAALAAALEQQASRETQQ